MTRSLELLQPAIMAVRPPSRLSGLRSKSLRRQGDVAPLTLVVGQVGMSSWFRFRVPLSVTPN